MPNSALALPPCALFAARGPAQRKLHRLAPLRRASPGTACIRRTPSPMSASSARWISHRQLGREKQPVAVDGRGERDAVLVDLAQRPQAEHLKAAGVGEDRPAPAHEAVQAAVRGDHLDPGTQPEMKGVAEHDLRAERFELVGRHRLDRAVGAHRHEHRRVDDAVRECELPASRFPAACDDLEFHRGDSTPKRCPRSSSMASP